MRLPPSSCDRIRQTDCGTDDVLRARLKTTGVTEHSFTLANSDFRGVEWKIYDVGGARHQRHAWAPYFDDGEPRSALPLDCVC